MARGKQGIQRNKQRKRNRERKSNRNRAPGVSRMTSELADKVEQAFDLISRGRFREAEELLDGLNEKHRGCPAIVEARMVLHQETDNHQRCCEAAKELLSLTPQDALARLMYAQSSMFCARLALAWENYRLFRERSPDHEEAPKAKNALEVIEPELKARRRLGYGGMSFEVELLHEQPGTRLLPVRQSRRGAPRGPRDIRIGS